MNDINPNTCCHLSKYSSQIFWSGQRLLRGHTYQREIPYKALLLLEPYVRMLNIKGNMKETRFSI